MRQTYAKSDSNWSYQDTPQRRLCAGGLAGFDNFIIRTLRADVRPPAPIAGCWAADPGAGRAVYLFKLAAADGPGREGVPGT